MVKTLVLVVVAATLAALGHVMLSKGMKTIGDMTEAPSGRLTSMVGRTVSNPWVLFGVLLQASFFFLYLTLLSRADVSLVLPLTALDYIVVALLAHALLGEVVTAVRWAGIAFIIVGVVLISKT
jgi:drug/metabolite transporter (DMT)-like permease